MVQVPWTDVTVCLSKATMASYMRQHLPYTLTRLISENGARGVDIVIISDDVTRPSYKDFRVKLV